MSEEHQCLAGITGLQKLDNMISKIFFFPFLLFEEKVFSLSVCQQLLPTEQGFSMKLLLSENVSQVLKAVKGCTVVYCWFPNAVGFFGGYEKLH